MLNTMMILVISFFSVRAFSASTEVSPNLEKNYQREVLFLNSYKKETQVKLDKLKSVLGQKALQEKKTLAELSAKLTSLQSQNQKIQEKVDLIHKQSQSLEEKQQMLQAIVDSEMSAQDLLKESKDKVSLEIQLTQVLEKKINDVKKASQLHSEMSEFFTDQGEKVSGEVVHLGSVARFGVTNSQAGLLYPIGQGGFQIWSEIPQMVVRQIKSGEWPSLLKVFLFEGTDKAIVKEKEKTLFSTLQAGGPIAWVIVVLGVFAAFLSLLRYFFLFQSQKSSVLRVESKVLNGLKKSRDKIEDIISEAILSESVMMDRFGALILVVASVAPLLGLLGTVTGMISTFDRITEFGTGDPKMLSGGISEALITTMLGLVVAIPILLIGQVLNSWSEKLKLKMEQVALARIQE